MRFRILSLLISVCGVFADVRNCVCDLNSATVATIRGCSLCVEAEKHPENERVILVRDNDPTKPDRWLALPRAKYDGSNPLAQMSGEERLLLWSAAVAKAKSVWGDNWAIAMNGDIARRQCHAHVHIGKLIEERETDSATFVDRLQDLPAVSDGTGLWFHPVGAKLHVHTGEQITETVLMR